ncbi:MAG: DUF4349 domain-containing protein [Candidatus Limnocylindrales bacterium]
MATNETEPIDRGPEPQYSAGPETASRRSISGLLPDLSSRRFLARSLAVAVVATVVLGAYVLGSPAGSAASLDSQRLSALQADQAYSESGGAQIAPAATAGPAVDGSTSKMEAQNAGEPAAQPDPLAASLDAALIVKTGQLSLEVTDLDKAVTQAQSTIAGLGGYVSSSNRSGTGDYATASVTYRLPVGRWDDALTALPKLGSKTLSEQTDTSDVSSQVVDLNARLDNLKTTESALQAIMARASAIPDVIAVQSQLSQTRGQIEQLTAQRDHFKDQAAMSTLTVTFQLPTKTVTSQATQDWTLGRQVDEAAAALVRIGQGLATMGVWALIVILPIGFGLLVLLAIFATLRRILGRGRGRTAPTPA